MANIRISQLPAAPSAITGSELIPVVQNGQTVQTTVQAITQSPTQTQTFLTVGAQASLPNSRFIGGGLGIGTSDAGAQGLYSLFLNGTSASLENSATGIVVKSGVNTITPRLIAAGTAGLGIANGDGISGNPTISLTGLALSAATLSGNGMVSVVGGSYFQNVTLTGSADQISVANPNGGSNPVFSIANNPVLPGSAGTVLPYGTTGDRAAVPINGTLRYNTTLALFEGYANGAWGAITTGSGVTSIATGTGLTGGPITSTGTISIANTAVTAGSYGSATQVGTFTVNAQGQLTAAANVSITAGGIGAVASVSGTANEITATGTTNVTLSLPSALTFTGKTVTGGAFNMTSATVGGDTVTTNTASQTLTNKTINGSNNTLSNIANASLTNSTIVLGTTTIALGGTSLTPAGLTSVTVTQNPVAALDLATKQYVDTLVSSGITYHAPVKYEVPSGNLTATYNQPGGAGVGIGATLTNAGTLVAFTPDGTVASVNDRILIYNQTNQAQNGVYVVTTVGSGSVAWVLTRASDADTYALKSPNGLGEGDAFFITSGATGAGETYVCNTVGVITFGTTAITFVQISATQIYSAGTGLTLTGTQFSISNTAVTAGAYGSASSVGTFTVNAQGQLTLAGNTAIAIANTQVSGLGTMSTQNANSVAITGGAIDGTAIGATTVSTVKATTVTTTGTGSPTDGAGQVYLNGATSNRVEWNTQGTGAPAFTTRSAGTKLLLYPSLSGSVADYAIGIAAATMWSSVPENNSSFKFKWYGATTEVASLDGAGAFTAVGGISGGTF